MDQDLFERTVAEALDALPEPFQQALDNVDVVVEDWPDPDAMRRAGVRHRSQLLGLYHGIPLTQRNQGYNLVLPDKISIYRQPIMMRCRNWEQVQRMVQRVVRHEVGHYFGISDERLLELDAY